MNSKKVLPFERNHYYVGKLLTSADFQAEQVYGIHKRRFINGMMFGDGIVCGLGVYSLDDQSIMIDSGMAIDPQGRDIVVESTTARKLSTIEGFESIEKGRAVLCIRYREEQVHPIYAMGSQNTGEGYECNRIREGWDLVLRNESEVELLVPESEFLIEETLYEDSEYEIKLSIPAVSSCGNPVRMDVIILPKAIQPVKLDLTGVVQTPAFYGKDGDQELDLDITLDAPITGVPVTFSYWITAQKAEAKETLLIIGRDTCAIHIGDSGNKLKENFVLRLSVLDATPRDLVQRAIGHVSLESHKMARISQEIPLAAMTLQRNKNTYLIEKISEEDVRRYVETTQASGMRANFQQYFIREQNQVVTKNQPPETETVPQKEVNHDPIYATGTCELAISGLKKGGVVYSDEVLHTLGRGSVMVDIGFEYLSQDTQLREQGRNTIYGNASLFKESDNPFTAAKTGVKVYNDRGSFVVGMELEQDAMQAVAVLRWVAVKLPGGSERNKIQRLAGKSIAAEPPTVVLATRESHFFNVRFKNMEPCTLSYELTEPHSGQMTSDGIYTAPGKEGVYEVRISCVDLPLVSTYAYVVVKKRMAEQEEGGTNKINAPTKMNPATTTTNATATTNQES